MEGRHGAFVGIGLDAAPSCATVGGGIGGIEIVADPEACAVVSLYQIEHDRAMAGLRHVAQFFQMLGAAKRHGIREFGKPGDAPEMHVLDLDIGDRAVWAG